MEFTGERMVPEISDSQTLWEHIYRYRFALPFVFNKTILDIACGEGYGTASLKNAGAKSVFGIDLSYKTCIHAKRKYGINIQTGSAEAIPFSSNSIDIVVSYETIEHINKPNLFISEVARVLKEDGILIISTPNKDTYIVRDQNPFHKFEMNKSEFIDILSKYFHNIRLFGQSPKVDNCFKRNSLCSSSVPTRSIRGFWRIYKYRNQLLDHYFNYREEIARSNAQELILEGDRFLMKSFCPYLVRPIISADEVYEFYLAVARKM